MPFIRRAQLLAAGLLAACSPVSIAAPTPAPVRSEITALLEKIKTSGCQFERNGRWHSAADAQAHLLRKLEYAENSRRTVVRTEQFIELAASKSSLSGKPYRIKCGAGAPQQSAVWLNRELQAIRAGGEKTRP